MSVFSGRSISIFLRARGSVPYMSMFLEFL